MKLAGKWVNIQHAIFRDLDAPRVFSIPPFARISDDFMFGMARLAG
jgi:hypothetical protein